MAGSTRLFVKAPLGEGAVVALGPDQAHRLAAVLRARSGDTLRLFNGRDGEWQARLAELRRGAARCVAERQLRAQMPEPDLWLVFSLLKRSPTDWLVQKATELGAAALLPVTTERTNADRVNLDRLRAVAIVAAEQCERLTLPVIEPPRPLLAVLAAWPAGRKLVVSVERAAAPPVAPAHGQAAGLLVGPEGGWGPAELDALLQHPFVVAASLGPRVLRAETAAIVGLALLQAEPICT